jgi:pentalenic acid synthase
MDSLPDVPRNRECPYRPPTEFDSLRARGPLTKVRLADGRPAWLVTDYTHARALLTDPRMSSNRAHPGFPVTTPSADRAGQRSVPRMDVLIGVDPPVHTTQRRLLIRSFTARRIAGLRPAIQRIVDSRLDAMLAAGAPVDLVPAFALPVPSMVICELLGVPYADHEYFEEQSRLRLDPRHSAGAMHQLYGYLDRLVEAKLADPGQGLLDDLITQQLAEGTLDRATVVTLGLILLIAGHDTTANMISLGTLALLDHPEQLAALRADEAAMANAVEELLRHHSIVATTPRLATQDIQIAGHLIRAGDGVLIANAGANHDETLVEHPGELDIHRPARGHVAFGYGIHQCLGQNLARAEMEIAFRTLFDRIPTLKLAVPAHQIPAQPGILAGLATLPVTW